MRFRLVLQGIAGRKILETSRLVFSEKISVNSFALPDTEGNTSGLSGREEFHNRKPMKVL